ncbi:MAG: hypothetical protein MZW92_70050 [Comamonadaceae bacterium]|nr:hypothetical protein [Comamonadaceae bacterium]
MLDSSPPLSPRRRHVQARSVLNLYSARHYQTDEALYDNFTKADRHPHQPRRRRRRRHCSRA